MQRAEPTGFLRPRRHHYQQAAVGMYLDCGCTVRGFCQHCVYMNKLTCDMIALVYTSRHLQVVAGSSEKPNNMKSCIYTLKRACVH